MRTETKNFETIPGTEIEIELPIGSTYGEEIELHVSPREGGGWHVAYLVADDSDRSGDDPINDDEGDDGYRWTFKDFNRNSRPGGGPEARDEYLESLKDDGVDPSRVFLVDRYEHGRCLFSLTGTGIHCPFDTAEGSGVLVAGPESAEWTDVRDGKVWTLRMQAASMLDYYTSWVNGDIYGVVYFDVDADGKIVGDYDSCWGFIGDESAADAIYDHTDVVRPEPVAA